MGNEPLVVGGVDIDALELFFKSAQLRSAVILNQGETVINPTLFKESHLAVIRNNPHSPTVLPFVERLVKYKNAIEG